VAKLGSRTLRCCQPNQAPMPAPHPRTGAAAQEQIGEQERDGDSRLAKAGDAPISQADLKRFVDETLAKGARSGCWGPRLASCRPQGRRRWACGIVFVLKRWAGAPSDVV
jgi:hypothetical protein